MTELLTNADATRIPQAKERLRGLAYNAFNDLALNSVRVESDRVIAKLWNAKHGNFTAFVSKQAIEDRVRGLAIGVMAKYGVDTVLDDNYLDKHHDRIDRHDTRYEFFVPDWGA